MSGTEKRCGNCAHWTQISKVSGQCYAPVPIWALHAAIDAGASNTTRNDSGKDCDAYQPAPKETET